MLEDKEHTMKRIIVTVATALLLLAGLAVPASADVVIIEPVCDPPSNYAHNHIVPTAQTSTGIGNSGHNVGSHHGYAGLCLGG